MNKRIKEYISYIVIIVAVVLIRSFIITPVTVDGTSMRKTLEDNEVLLLYKLDDNLERFDIIVFEYNNEKLIKRVIGLPGDNIKYENDELYINDELIKEEYGFGYTTTFETTVKENEYFVLGDNREDSIDSRIIGAISEEQINGKIVLRIFPFTKLGNVE